MAILTFLPITTGFAYTGGLLNGKTLNIGSNITQLNETTNLITDNNESTSYVLQAGNSINNDTAWYTFTDPVTITGYKVKLTSTGGTIRYYDKNGYLIGESMNLTNYDGSLVSISPMKNVKTIAFDNTTGATREVFEFDVFGTVETTPTNTKTLDYYKGNTIGSPSEDINDDIFTDGITESTTGYTVTATTLIHAYSNTLFNASHVDFYTTSTGRVKIITYSGQQGSFIETSSTNYIPSAGWNRVYFNQSNINSVAISAQSGYSNIITEMVISDNGQAEPEPDPEPIDTDAPAEISDLLVTTTTNSIKFDWQNPSDVDFRTVYIYQDMNLVGTASNGTFTVTGLTPETTYNYSFKTEDTNGNVSTGTAKVVTTNSEQDLVAPSAPTGLSGDIASNGASLKWSRNTETDIQGYNIYVDGVKENATPVTNIYYSLTGLEADTAYSIQITAVDTSGNESAKSSAFSITPDAGSMPILKMGYTLTDVAEGTSVWFNELWLIVAFAVAIPLAFYISNRVKLLFLS